MQGIVYLVIRHHDSAGREVKNYFPVALLPNLAFHARVATDVGCDRRTPLIESKEEHCCALQDVGLPGIIPASLDES